MKLCMNRPRRARTVGGVGAGSLKLLASRLGGCFTDLQETPQLKSLLGEESQRAYRVSVLCVLEQRNLCLRVASLRDYRSVALSQIPFIVAPESRHYPRCVVI